MNNLIADVDPILLILVILIIGFSIATIFLIVKNKLKSNKKIVNPELTKMNEAFTRSVFDEKKNMTEIIEKKPYTQRNDNIIAEVNEPNENSYKILKAVEAEYNIKFKTPVVFYMTKPVDNYFPLSAKSDKPEGTIYKFFNNQNEDDAHYEIHCNGAPVNEIVKRANAYLLPACIEDNLSNENTRNILTLKPGKVFLSDNKWIIQNKAIIRYE